MSKAAFTVKIFGIYLLLLGPVLMVAPNVLLSIFRIAPTEDVWIRVVGLLAFNIGIYYWFAAKCEASAFFRASVYTRSLVLIAFAGFAGLGWVSPMIIVFGLVDFGGGVWTHFALRSA